MSRLMDDLNSLSATRGVETRAVVREENGGIRVVEEAPKTAALSAPAPNKGVLVFTGFLIVLAFAASAFAVTVGFRASLRVEAAQTALASASQDLKGRYANARDTAAALAEVVKAQREELKGLRELVEVYNKEGLVRTEQLSGQIEGVTSAVRSSESEIKALTANHRVFKAAMEGEVEKLQLSDREVEEKLLRLNEKDTDLENLYGRY